MSEIGRGSFGRVDLHWRDPVTPMAVKSLRLGQSGIPSLVELSILKTYKHPYLVNATQITISDGEVKITMEYGPQNLYEYISKGYTANFKDWSTQLSRAVACLHSDMLIHCDIKSDNVIVMSDGSVKLIDFSLSLIKYERGQTFSHRIGALGYRAPEVMAGGRWNEKVDIWGLGCVFYEMVTSKVLIECASNFDKDTLKSNVRDAVTAWRRQRGDAIPGNVVSVNPAVRVGANWEKVQQTRACNIIDSMLGYIQQSRPSIRRVIGSLGTWEPISIDACSLPREYTIAQERTQLVDGYLENINQNKRICKLMYKIDALLENITCDTERLDVSYWISHKLLLNRAPHADHIFTPIDRILELEIASCVELEFLLHTLVNEGDP